MTNAENPPDDDAAESARGREDRALRRMRAELEMQGLVVTAASGGAHYRITDRDGKFVGAIAGSRRLAG